MEESYGEGIAIHAGPESCGDTREGSGSVDRGTCGPGIQPRKSNPLGRRRCKEKRKATPDASPTRDTDGLHAVRDPAHVRNHHAREPGDPRVARGRWCRGTHREAKRRTPMMHGSGKSDSRVVPRKLPNEAGRPAEEVVEGRRLTKGNPRQQNAARTQGRQAAPSALERVRQVAKREKRMRFTAL